MSSRACGCIGFWNTHTLCSSCFVLSGFFCIVLCYSPDSYFVLYTMYIIFLIMLGKKASKTLDNLYNSAYPTRTEY